MEKDAKEGKNEFWCEDGILYYLMAAPVDEAEAVRLDEGGTEYLDSGEATQVLIDLQQSTKFSSGARKIWVKFLQNPHIKKTAFFGGSVFVRTLASFVMTATHRDDIKFFLSKEEAMEWLQKG